MPIFSLLSELISDIKTLLFVGESIPPRTVSLAATSLDLMLAVANLDSATYQVSAKILNFRFYKMNLSLTFLNLDRDCSNN